MKRRNVKTGQIYAVSFEGKGSVQKGIRPALVIQNNLGNKFSDNVIVVPLTSSLEKANIPTHVLVTKEACNGELAKDSLILCENPYTISQKFLGKYITTVNKDVMIEVAKAVTLSTALISILTPETLKEIWLQASALGV